MSKDTPQEPPSPIGPLVYSGMVGTDECDEMGHMNVRYYVKKSDEGLVALLRAIGLGAARRKRDGLVLKIQDHHIWYLEELMPGTGIRGHAAILRIEAETLVAATELRRSSDGRIAATLLTRIALLNREGIQIALSPALRSAANQFATEGGRHIGPRSVEFDRRGPSPSMEDVRRLDLMPIRLGALSTEHFMHDGSLRPESVIGLVSDGIPNLVQSQRRAAQSSSGATRVGGAALEYRIAYRGTAEAGDTIGVFSGRRAMAEKTFHMVHWVFNLETEAPIATAEAVAISFDLATRKSIVISPETRAAFRADLKPDLWV